MSRSLCSKAALQAPGDRTASAHLPPPRGPPGELSAVYGASALRRPMIAPACPYEVVKARCGKIGLPRHVNSQLLVERSGEQTSCLSDKGDVAPAADVLVCGHGSGHGHDNCRQHLLMSPVVAALPQGCWAAAEGDILSPYECYVLSVLANSCPFTYKRRMTFVYI